jgi:hypothetical protein
MTSVFALPITWGCLAGLQARFEFLLGWTLIVTVLALGIAVGSCEETRECRKAAVAAGLSLEESLWTVQARRRLRRRGPFQRGKRGDPSSVGFDDTHTLSGHDGLVLRRGVAFVQLLRCLVRDAPGRAGANLLVLSHLKKG